MLATKSVLHEEAEAQLPQWKGYVPGRAKNLDRNRETGHVQMYNDYFHPEVVLYQNLFRFRF
jgi:hypothetical protein